MANPGPMLPPRGVSAKSWVWFVLGVIPMAFTITTLLGAPGAQKLWALLPGALTVWILSVSFRAGMPRDTDEDERPSETG